VQRDPEHDADLDAPEVRRAHLERFLASRLGRARFMLIGEALGYQGGHFSGLPMTSERILLGFQSDRGALPEHVLPGFEPQRTSKPELKEKGFTEPTATIVWGELVELLDDTRHALLWNAFAWHPFEADQGLLTNRRPAASELEFGLPTLRAALDLFPRCTCIAVGKVAGECLSRLNREHLPVRHPAQGGATQFRSQIREMLADYRD
jgi:hypothetical protein